MWVVSARLAWCYSLGGIGLEDEYEEGKSLPGGAMLGRDYWAMTFGAWFSLLAGSKFRMRISLLCFFKKKGERDG